MSDEKESVGHKNESTELKALQQKVASLEKVSEDHLDGWKRAKADYINLKKETDKRLQESVQFANAALLLELLPVADHFKLAVQHIPQTEKEKDWVKGMLHIHKEFLDMLRKFGVEEIATDGQVFDPEKHEAIGKEKVDGKKSGMITREAAPGYLLYGKVLQHAKVYVAE